jgi:hypothetical protein
MHSFYLGSTVKKTLKAEKTNKQNMDIHPLSKLDLNP